MTEKMKILYNQQWQEFGIDVYINNDRLVSKINLSEFFPKQQEIILDLGFGTGDSLLHYASNYPRFNFVGIEVYKSGVARVMRQATKMQINNLKVINFDAQEVLKLIPEQSIKGVCIYFPDPWFKTKHNKRRLINKEFINLLAKKITTFGFLHIATDWREYATAIQDILRLNPKFIFCLTKIFNSLEHLLQTRQKIMDEKFNSNDINFIPRPYFRAKTKYETKAQKSKREIFDLIVFRKP